MRLQNLIEKRLVQNLLKMEACLFKIKNKTRRTNYFLGFKKGILFLNIETSFKNYFRVLNIVQELKKTKKSILFVGCPFGLEKSILKYLAVPNFLFDLKEYVHAMLLNSSLLNMKVCFVIAYCHKICPPLKNCFIKGIPTAKFIFEDENKTLIDYVILFNLHSKGVIGLFLYLVRTPS